MERSDIEVVTVFCGAGLGDQPVDEMSKPVLVMVVRDSCHVDDGVGVGLLGDGVGHLQQSHEVLDRAAPAHI